MSGIAADILREGFGRAFVIPLWSDITLSAMRAFGTYDMKAPVFWAALGAMLGTFGNWLVGRGAREGLERARPLPVLEKRRQQLRIVLLPLLMFSWFPLGSLLAFLAGLLRLAPLAVLPIAALGWAVYYYETVLL